MREQVMCAPILPDEYVPSKLRPRRSRLPEFVMYAIGQDDDGSGYGMWHGPTREIDEMLEVVGRDERSVIIRFNLDGSDEVLYRWTGRSWKLSK